MQQEKKYGKCPECGAPCEVIEEIDVQEWDGDVTEVPYDQYVFQPQKKVTTVWVKAVTIVLDLKGRIAEVFQDTNDALNFCRENRGFTPITHFVTCKSPSKEGNKEQETGQSNKDDAIADLVKSMQEYIALLGDEISEIISYVPYNGWQSSRIEKGQQLRKKIEQLYNEYQKQK